MRRPNWVQERADAVCTALKSGATPQHVGARRLQHMPGELFTVEIGRRWRVLFERCRPDRARVVSHEEYNRLTSANKGARARWG